ncbi:MAG: hypothetical protein HUU50_14155 [Candidatus Brocadiae bacterium]|nr:hypothetical protein [Candidatus Brocadiia bacterium]
MKLFIMILCLSLGFSLAAQNNNPEQPLQEPNQDAKKWQETSDQWQKNDPSPVDEEKGKQISRYFEEALKNYEEILGDQKDAEVRTTEKRIEANVDLLDGYQKKLSTSENSLRKIKLEYMRKFLVLKNSFAENRIDKPTYQKELQKVGDEYTYKVKSLSSDQEFYQKETQKTSERLKALQELNRINKIIINNDKPVPEEAPRKLTDLERLLEGVNQMGCFEVKNFCLSPELK